MGGGEILAAAAAAARATGLQRLGAAAFGAVIGWYLYYVARYRKDTVGIGDVASVVGALGGGAVLTLFPAATDLFGAYGIGVFLGFFGYFAMLMVLVGRSDNFNRDWFLDGRRKVLSADQTNEGVDETSHPMEGRTTLLG
jgi:hypothetical protein